MGVAILKGHYRGSTPLNASVKYSAHIETLITREPEIAGLFCIEIKKEGGVNAWNICANDDRHILLPSR